LDTHSYTYLEMKEKVNIYSETDELRGTWGIFYTEE